MKAIVSSIVLLGLSNVFMTFAWHAHLKSLNHRPWIVAALCILGVVFFVFRACWTGA